MKKSLGIGVAMAALMPAARKVGFDGVIRAF